MPRAWFTTGPNRALPATLTVTELRGGRYLSVHNLRIDWATASNQPTTITFDQVRTSEPRLEMTSPSPGSTTGFLQIAELSPAAPPHRPDATSPRRAGCVGRG